jgi:transcriptional regulator with XRE-family HTH domain
METPGQQFARRVREVREAQGLSQQQVSERLAGIGVKIDRTAVARVENGTRRVTVDEVFQFAQALNASPLELLTAGGRVVELDERLQRMKESLLEFDHELTEKRAELERLRRLEAGEEEQ